ncbi:MAG: hypothetical protein GY747_07395 [Planctomycetes bacterium]|nr:hypothetical protein [Planctomycetota bacterium]MCP4770341.1 hypothetical protein [Planctomycetota bacterium]MCP4861909.1 hypothetical protein [Planctomycetota bacterium]
MNDRTSYIQRQENAKTVQSKNSQLPSQRDSLRDMWEDFLPVAENELADLATDLNPHLVQKRIHSSAEQLGCTVRIQQKPGLEGDTEVRFVLTGEGRYTNLVKLVDQLEQGQHFVRFEKLSYIMPSMEYRGSGGGAVRIAAVVLIPAMPPGIDLIEIPGGNNNG